MSFDRKGRRLISPGIIKLGQRTLSQVFKVPVRQEVEDELAFHLEMRTREYEFSQSG